MINTTDANNLIKSEIYYNKYKYTLKQREYFILITKLEAMARDGATARQIRKFVDAYPIMESLDDDVKDAKEKQTETISGLAIVGLGALGFTHKESVKNKKVDIKRGIFRTALNIKNATADEAVSNKELQGKIKEIKASGAKLYKSSLLTFYKTETKTAREQAYKRQDKKQEIKGWLSLATLDNRTSEICLSFHNALYSSKDYASRDEIPNPPPRHPNCRTIIQAIPSDTDTDLLKGDSLDDFLKNNPDTARNILGKAKHDLYIDEKLKAYEVLNFNSGKLFTNDEIKKELKK